MRGEREGGARSPPRRRRRKKLKHCMVQPYTILYYESGLLSKFPGPASAFTPGLLLRRSGGCCEHLLRSKRRMCGSPLPPRIDLTAY